MSLSREDFEKVFEYISQIGGKGSNVQSIYEQLRGINGLGTHPTMPVAREQFGLTFFTRPRMNLSDANLRAWRPFFSMIGGEGTVNIPRGIRAMLDPVGVWRNSRGSPLTDPEQVFVPWLSNGLVSQSGWPEIAPGVFESQQGNHHESWSMIDDTIKNYKTWDLNMTFRNGAGNAIVMLLYVWVVYASMVYEGDMVPYPDAIMQHRIDYHSRIYRFSLDANKKRIMGWWSTIAYPQVAPSATGANFSLDSPFNEEAKQLSVIWKCHGCDTFDPIVFSEFNNAVQYFNPRMHPAVRDKFMVKLTDELFHIFNYKTWFQIDTDEQILERWVTREDYDDWMASSKVAVGTRFAASTLIPRSRGGVLASAPTPPNSNPSGIIT